MGHTPGPWKKELTVCEPCKGHFVKYVSAPSAAGIVSQCWLPAGGSMEELEANARLIAAAPDMLEALHDVLRYCVTPSGLPDKNKGRTPEQDAAMAKAKAAIAKAEGNQ